MLTWIKKAYIEKMGMFFFINEKIIFLVLKYFYLYYQKDVKYFFK